MLLLIVDVLVFILLLVGVVRDEDGIVSTEGHRLVLQVLLEELGPELAVRL